MLAKFHVVGLSSSKRLVKDGLLEPSKAHNEAGGHVKLEHTSAGLSIVLL